MEPKKVKKNQKSTVISVGIITMLLLVQLNIFIVLRIAAGER